ncbi:hypothetical protein GCM10010169_53400 [Micromonospora fulviviridis]|nr:hypothetical protein GCM10010169_53400 [Micromonospora fulviviridis]
MRKLPPPEGHNGRRAGKSGPRDEAAGGEMAYGYDDFSSARPGLKPSSDGGTTGKRGRQPGRTPR